MNKNSITPQELLIQEYNKIVDHNTGLLKKDVSEYVDCPLCNSKNYKKFWVKDGFHYIKCQECEFVYLNPRLNKKSLFEFYNGPWVKVYNSRKFYSKNEVVEKNNNRNLMEIKSIIKNGKLLEIGCGDGHFLQLARDKDNFEVFGVELDPETSQYARTKRGLINVKTEAFENIKYPENFFDVVYMNDVLEHLQNPLQIMEECYKILKEGGLIVINVPNVDGLVYKFVGEKHTCVFGFEHLNFFSDKTLSSILTKIGFDVKKIIMNSSDFILIFLFRYFFGGATFTSISNSSKQHELPRIDKLTNRLGDEILPKVANHLRRGSYISVYAIKK
jgi:2-polyprenyl-3-methyl-5-hydroxy-6-metoxy-1,4-benzoquinol methylase/Zn ribbon nucleic-acid-binding protein